MKKRVEKFNVIIVRISQVNMIMAQLKLHLIFSPNYVGKLKLE